MRDNYALLTMLIKKSGSVCPILITLLTAGTTPGNATEVGPANGSLVVVGGNMQDESIVRRIIDLAGGPDALLVVIPTAGAAPNTNDSRNYNDSFHRLLQFRAAGARNVMLLHTRDRGVADSERFVEPLGRARGVFFDEGRQWRLADVYLNTRTHRELLSLLDRGGVIAGSSAGASILASFLARGDTKGNHIMIGDHQEGFGFLRNVAIDQHLLARNRLLDMLEIVRRHPRLLGIGIDEDTAIVVQQDQSR